MDPPDQLGAQCRVNRAVFGDPALPAEGRRTDPYVEMALPPARCPGVTRMTGGVIHHFYLCRLKRCA